MPARAAFAAALRARVKDGEIVFDAAGALVRGPAAVVLLHGWALDRRMWAPQIEALSQARPVIAIDRRGYGASTAPPDITQEAADIATVLDAAQVGAAVIVGMSQAGRVAAEFAMLHPGRCAGVVFQGARLGSIAAASAPDIAIGDYIALVRGGRLGAMKALWRAHPLMQLSDTRHQPAIDQMLEAYNGADLLAERPPLDDLDDAALARISVPALIVTGENDTPLRRRIAEQLATLLPHSERMEFAGAGHLCNLCAAEAYNKTLSRFLDRVDLTLTARIS